MPDTANDIDLAYLSATQALAMFTARTLSPVELLEALIDRIEATEGTINAVVDRRYDEARGEAKASADRYAHGQPLPLDGLPVAAKEEHPMAGRSWRQGSHVLADVVADTDHPIIERITQAGGIVHIRTATPEFCCTGFCHSAMWGITRNPWSLDWSPGGSSGGSGAALAAGYAPLATGSDIAGSIRIPSSLSGVVGFKPPFGRVPARPPYNLDQYCHDGPMARSVADVALLENVIAGAHSSDTASLRFPPTIPPVHESVEGLHVALCLQMGDWPLAVEVRANTLRVAQSLRGAGAVVDEVQLPWTTDQVWAAAQAHFAAIMGAGITAVDAEHGDLLNDYTRAFARSMTSELSYYEGLELEGHLWQPLGQLFERFDALICPTMATDGFRAGDSYLQGPFDVGDGQVGHHIMMAMTLPFNLFSRCPVVAVPSGRAANGVPTGVQVVGRTHDDVTAFRVAAAVESTGVGYHDPAWRPFVRGF
jgi:Asp-tRNA(Asn)/Glu-tRNA(Gln) amidotransferase A subunit family amidase